MRYRLYLLTVIVFALFWLAPHCDGHEEGTPEPDSACVNVPVVPGSPRYTCGGPGAAPPPNWPPYEGGNYILHLPPLTAAVQLTPSVRNWSSGWAPHYNNAIGWWNSRFNVPIFADVQTTSDARVWVLRPGSEDENQVNIFVAGQGYQFEQGVICTPSGPGAWASTNTAQPVFINGHWHRAYEKICLWGNPNPVAPNTLNNQSPGWHYWWLTLVHELGHVLSLNENHLEPACVMRSGLAMLHPCYWERDWVSAHHGR
jgi:hypothetical protein